MFVVGSDKNLEDLFGSKVVQDHPQTLLVIPVGDNYAKIYFDK